ncbi:MAG: HAMP domain-containing sensor histidine kinase [Deltaproteobacteria bacterium]|nr:HAMP domain-containing sensor histidine kinase [Deltaproteobacteria bacterium]
MTGRVLATLLAPAVGASLCLELVAQRVAPIGFPWWLCSAAALVLAAALGGGLLARRHAARMRERLAYLTDRMRALPEEALRSPSRLPAELAELDAGIDALRACFHEARCDEERAIESGRKTRLMKAQFFAGMSHDLRSPLNSVLGFTEILLKGVEGPLHEGPRAAVTAIAQKADKTLVLIKEILDTAGLEAGRFELEYNWVPSVEILTDCVTAAERLAAGTLVAVVSELQPGLPPVRIDKDRVRQALLGLIHRAVGSLERGTVRVKASREPGAVSGEPGWLKVSIADTGRAIPVEERERIFEAFHASEASAGRSLTGMNMSLSLARNIIRLHGGDVEVDSVEGRGSIFTVTLPLDEPGGRL